LEYENNIIFNNKFFDELQIFMKVQLKFWVWITAKFYLAMFSYSEGFKPHRMYLTVKLKYQTFSYSDGFKPHRMYLTVKLKYQTFKFR